MKNHALILERGKGLWQGLARTKVSATRACNDLRCPPSNQNSFLDGLRTIAILLVVNSHFAAEFTTVHGNNFFSNLPFVVNGWVGVDLFFVLSGFFIGGQLWKELQRTGTISVPRFLLRRGLRIWPLYFFTFIVVFIAFWPAATGKSYGWADLVFLVNYFTAGIVLGGWSLSTEEQFYILAPVLLHLFARGHKFASIRVWLWCILAFLPLLRAAIWVSHCGHFFQHDPALFGKLYYPFHTHCDGLVMGLIISNLWVSRERASISGKSALVLVPVAAMAMVFLRNLHHEIFVFSGLALFFGSLTWFGVVGKSRLFRSSLFYWISRLSFGMYLNHPYLIRPVLNGLLPHLRLFPADSVLTQMVGVSLLVLISGGISLVTFCLVEHPFLELRSRLLGKPKMVAQFANA
jgi:peptidoglycan/LPS O-acetylase OafA/YrhL